ncbi:MAG: TIGR03560 family F420-dependent LLM class oxidoreductase [Actinomycetota bacterium]
MIKLPADALVVLAGPSGAGKSTWAAQWFRSSQVVGADQLRGVVGEHEHDLRASAAAFDVLDAIVEHRLARGLLTVVDTLGMDPDRRQPWLASAARHGRPTRLVVFDDEPKVYRSRNRSRPQPVPAKVHKAQLEQWAAVRADLGREFDAVDQAGPVVVLPSSFLGLAPVSDAPPRLQFGLQVSAFDVDDGADLADELVRIGAEAERAGFTSLWLMDHYVQVPQVGREWDPMLEPYTTLGYLAAATERIELGTMVSSVTHRSIGHLAKSVATLDVLSKGRARCGIGLGWFEREHRAYGHRFPPTAERYELLEDALEALPLYWGPGAPAFEGRRFSTPEALCYPRPVRARIPVLVGGSGPRRTLALVARHADGCNLFGGPDEVRALIDALDGHCAEVGRDRHEIEITQLSPLLSAPDAATLRARVAESTPSSMSPEAFAARTSAAPVDQHIERFAALAEAGVQTVIVSLADVARPEAVAEFQTAIDAFRP